MRQRPRHTHTNRHTNRSVTYRHAWHERKRDVDRAANTAKLVSDPKPAAANAAAPQRQATYATQQVKIIRMTANQLASMRIMLNPDRLRTHGRTPSQRLTRHAFTIASTHKHVQSVSEQLATILCHEGSIGGDQLPTTQRQKRNSETWRGERMHHGYRCQQMPAPRPAHSNPQHHRATHDHPIPPTPINTERAPLPPHAPKKIW